VPALTVGLFAAGPGYTDVQEPHGEDEVYVVLAGHAVIDVDGSHSSVAAGSIIYVPRGLPHHFHDVSDDLRVVVVFVPPPA
jgi:mannose-6-phosphate isomerase-like protein (cupin superfamily)